MNLVQLSLIYLYQMTIISVSNKIELKKKYIYLLIINRKKGVKKRKIFSNYYN
jgi:hypothetical protein